MRPQVRVYITTPSSIVIDAVCSFFMDFKIVIFLKNLNMATLQKLSLSESHIVGRESNTL